jgi:hypothetical protein
MSDGRAWKTICQYLLGYLQNKSCPTSDHQKSAWRQAGCEHGHVYLTMLYPGASLPILVIYPELLDPFLERHIFHELFNPSLQRTILGE